MFKCVPGIAWRLNPGKKWFWLLQLVTKPGDTLPGEASHGIVGSSVKLTSADLGIQNSASCSVQVFHDMFQILFCLTCSV